MKFTIDTIAKTIQIEGLIEIKQLLSELKNLNIGHDYKLISTNYSYGISNIGNTPVWGGSLNPSTTSK